MSFEYASVTKGTLGQFLMPLYCAEPFMIEIGLMLSIAITSITAGLFDVKYYLHLQLVPHISKYHQVMFDR